MKNILCYGDSNTFGFIPVSGKRYSIDERWTGILQKLLGNEYRIIEEGLNGRTTVFEDPSKAGRNGKAYLEVCLESHKPIDLIIISLGTNDLKTKFSASENVIAQNMRRLILTVKNYDYGIGYNKPEILILAPAPLGYKADISEELAEFDKNSIATSKKLAFKYQFLSKQENVYFFDIGSVAQSSEEDQVHFTLASHLNIANALYEEVKNIL